MLKRLFFVLLLILCLAAVGLRAAYYMRGEKKAIPVEQTPEWQVCEQWKSLKNAGDSAAENLIDPLTQTPTEPITEEQADNFDANFCLHHPKIRIESLRALSGNRFLFVAKGSVSAPELLIRSGSKVDSVSRVLFHPDLVVEVRNGKIHPIRSQMHTEP